MQFTGPELAELREALKSAFPTTSELALFLSDRLDKNLEDFAAPNNRDLVFFELLRAANAGEWVIDIYKAARSFKPGNTPLKAVAEKLALSPTPPSPASLEKIVKRGLPMLDINVWTTRLGEIQTRVGRVVLGKGGGAQALGTGFLVGPSVVMTNHHVIANALNGAMDPKQIHVQFDHFVLPSGSVEAGTFVPLHQDWLSHATPHSAVDVTVHPIETDANEGELDFALLRLDRAFGSEPFGPPSASGSAPPRGWIDLNAPAPRAADQEPVVIVQHPDGKPMKLAFDDESVIGYSPSSRRLRYRTNTEPGSSGSPAFNYNLQILALHHAGDPNWFEPPQYNEGIPIEAITRYLADKGLSGKLSE